MGCTNTFVQAVYIYAHIYTYMYIHINRVLIVRIDGYDSEYGVAYLIEKVLMSIKDLTRIF